MQTHRNGSGFSGVNIPVTIQKNAGMGIEVAGLKGNVGIGALASYIPNDSTTFGTILS